ncbi:sigma-70 family RNA polymerase sigma factor [Echinicola jeungdonensis]|uniref:RNA polymerase sigma factor n=1 Tax=Echinicola jeungdonensis TaxID=709343 RepID=A0ABV5J1C5_9BACT|nr:sigma-70 family RNA polymerase sigma factor [Echinicola jeungdonensis]MDN3668443.1 sigma-70 family RNA polymerase sigma factor [Echinicola jeungdonensis]
MLLKSIFTSEQDLIKACLKDNPQAQRALYEQYAPGFLAICKRYMKDGDQAEDVMIEGFMKIFEKLNQFEGKGSFEGWMKKIMVRQALLDLRKKRKIDIEINPELFLNGKLPIYETSELEAEELLKMIQELPEGFRTVFNLYAIEGYSHKEIGDLLEISENTSKSQLCRARACLQKKLAQIHVIERRIHE